MTETQPTTSEPTNDSATESFAIPRADPKLIDELFSMDPLKLSDQDLDLIIRELRADRLAFLTPPIEEAKTAKAGKSSGKKSKSLDLDMLDLL